RDGFPGGLVPEAREERLDQLPMDALLWVTGAWGASGDVHPDAAVDADLRALEDADAEKSADLAQAVPGWGGRQSALRAARAWAAEPWTPDAPQSGGRSCAAAAGPERPVWAERPILVLQAELAAVWAEQPPAHWLHSARLAE